MGGELAGIRTQDPRLKRALLYQLSYELVQGRFFKANTGPALPLASAVLLRASVALPLAGAAANGICPEIILAGVLYAGTGPLPGGKAGGEKA